MTREPGGAEVGFVGGSISPTTLVPLCEVSQLDPEYGCLQLMQTAVVPHHRVEVLPDPAMSPEQPDPGRDFPVIGNDHSTIAGSAQIL